MPQNSFLRRALLCELTPSEAIEEWKRIRAAQKFLKLIDENNDFEAEIADVLSEEEESEWDFLCEEECHIKEN